MNMQASAGIARRVLLASALAVGAMAVAGCGGQEPEGGSHNGGAHGGSEKHFSEPKSYAEAVDVIDHHLQEIDSLIKAGKLDQVHAEAAVIRDVAGRLGQLALESGSGVPRDAVKDVNLAAKDLAARFDAIDRAGDSGDLAGTKKVYGEMVALFERLQKHAPGQPHDH